MISIDDHESIIPTFSFFFLAISETIQTTTLMSPIMKTVFMLNYVFVYFENT